MGEGLGRPDARQGVREATAGAGGTSGRQGLGFYALRHTFRTVADESKDQPAVDFAMGHEVPHMSAVYRETIRDVRLRAVTDYVRKWLFERPAGMASPEAEG